MLDSSSAVARDPGFDVSAPGRPPATAPPLVALESISVGLGGHTVLADASIAFRPGRPFVVLGPNGAGKTTLLKVAMGLVAPTSGKVVEAPAAGRRLRKAFVFQRPVMLRRSAAANVAFALRAAARPTGSREIEGILARVGLAGMGDRMARRLSGGEQQRLALARALATAPDIVFLDEPTASLDPAATKAVEEIIASIADAGVAVVMSTHDLGQARRLAGNAALLVKGRIVEAAPATEFFAAPARQETRRFLAGDIVL